VNDPVSLTVTAFDLSLTSPAVASIDAAGTLRAQCGSTKNRRGPERLVTIRDWVMFNTAGADAVTIEDLPHGLRNAAAGALGEMHGVVKVALWEAGIPFTLIPPANLKKYATGKGNADKLAMMSAACHRLGYDGSSSDEVDALWMVHMTLDHHGAAVIKMPALNRCALDTIDWAGQCDGR